MRDFCVISVAYSTCPFSKIFINSFKKYYPDVKLCIIDNNKRNDNPFFKDEIKYLQKTFDILWDSVKAGGYYVIEDLATSYWKDYDGV